MGTSLKVGLRHEVVTKKIARWQRTVVQAWTKLRAGRFLAAVLSHGQHNELTTCYKYDAAIRRHYTPDVMSTHVSRQRTRRAIVTTTGVNQWTMLTGGSTCWRMQRRIKLVQLRNYARTVRLTRLGLLKGSAAVELDDIAKRIKCVTHAHLVYIQSRRVRVPTWASHGKGVRVWVRLRGWGL
jgi:hypothetical protein